jgi:hypothetical protein
MESEFFREDVQNEKFNVSNLGPADMKKIQKIMMEFPKEQLKSEDVEPMLRAARKITFGSTLASVVAFVATRKIPNTPKFLPPLASIAALMVVGRSIAETQKKEMWESIVNGNTLRSEAIRRALRSDHLQDSEIPLDPTGRQKVVFPLREDLLSSQLSMKEIGGEPRKFRTWDDIRKEESRRREVSQRDHDEVFKGDKY